MNNTQEQVPAVEKKKSHAKGELKLLALLLIISVGLFVDSLRSSGIVQGVSNGPGSIPQLVSLVLIIMIVGTAISLLRQGYEEGNFKDVIAHLFNKEVVILLITISAYGALVETFHFIPTTVVFLIATMYLLDRKQIIKKAIISVVTVGVLVLIFSTLFQVVLP